MRTRKVTAIALSALIVSAIMLGSADRAEARRGWGWGGIGVGVATALILGGIYHHRHHRYYYGGYPSYSYGYTRLTAMGIIGLGITAPGTSTFGPGSIVPAATIIGTAVIGDCDTFWDSDANIGKQQGTEGVASDAVFGLTPSSPRRQTCSEVVLMSQRHANLPETPAEQR